MQDKANSSRHVWHFFRSSGFDQVLIRTGADIANLKSLDQKLWIALSCPTHGIRFDSKTLELLDSDHDKRVRVPEVLAAIEWLKPRLVNLDCLFEGTDVVKLSSLNSQTEEGKALLSNARRTLKNLGKGEASAISLADVSDTAAIFAQTSFNGDGIITPDAHEAVAVRQTIEEIIDAFGSETDRSGKPGINQAKTDTFFDAVDAHLSWLAAAEKDAAILVLGDATSGAFEALEKVRAKVDDYFTRCRMAAYDPRAVQALNRPDNDLVALADKDLTDNYGDLAAFPLALVEARSVLSLTEGTNPYWAEALEAFHKKVVAPIIGQDVKELTVDQWEKLKAGFVSFSTWQTSHTGTEVAGLGVERLKELQAGKDRAIITQLIADDLALAPENAHIEEVERLIRYHANLIDLLNNYVNMGRLYDPKTSALFQVGTLYMDARACNLCFEVKDEAAHSGLAGASKCCLVYCKLMREGEAPRTVCAVFTAGFANTLWVGRNGVFYDTEGRDWDATITKVVENALSLREAFWTPWRKIGTMIGNQVTKILSAKQDSALASVSERIETAELPAPAEAAAAPKKMEGAALASSVAAIGIAVGLVGSAIGGLVGLVAGQAPWKTAVGIVAVLLLVSGPSVILAWFKLRARDLAPVLNAGGWAINRRLRFSLKLGRLFTTQASLPPGGRVDLRDPYADRSYLRSTVVGLIVLAIVAAVAWSFGLLDRVLPEKWQRQPVAEVSADMPTEEPASDLVEQAAEVAVEAAAATEGTEDASAPEAENGE